MDYSKFQNMASSEKVTLAIIRGSKRIRGFTLSGGVYSVSMPNAVISSVAIDSVNLQAAALLDSLIDNCYFFDQATQTLYVKTTKNPNSSFLVVTQKYFFANRPCTLPHDLGSGFEVYFEPMIKNTSTFGTELDVLNEATSAIEGKGTITFHNDIDFWPKNFDKVFFENQIAEIFSWSPTLKPSEAKLLFRGYVDSKSYDSNQIKLDIKDLLYNLRAAIDLKNISDLELRNDPSLDTAKQRIIYGSVKGHRPINLDKLISGSYPITGTVAVFLGQTSVVGSGTIFKNELTMGDKLILSGNSFTIARVVSNTALELTSPWGLPNATMKAEVSPASNKDYMNREWLLAGHALSQPVAYIQSGSTTQRLILNSTRDMFDGDDLYIGEIGSGELVRIAEVINESIISLAQSTQIVYPADTPIHRPCVQNVRMNEMELVYGLDYTVDPNSARLSITRNAEEQRAPLIEASERVTVTSGNDYFTGSGTKFTQYIKPGYKVRPQSTDDFYQVLDVTDTQINLTEPYTGPSFTSSVALPEITSISGLTTYKEKYFFRAIPATMLMQGKYFKIWDSKGSVAVWFDIGNVGTEEPEHGCNRSIEIKSIDTGDNQFTVLKKIAQILNQDEEFTCSIFADTMTISNNIMGVRPAAKDPTNGFSVFNRKKNEQKVTFVADVGDSLDETYFIMHDGSGTVAYWIATDNNPGAVEPSHSANRSVKITTINTDDSATVVRNKVKAYVVADGFTCTDLGSDSFVATMTMVGPSLGTLPSGFSLSISQEGKSAWDLNGKYFVLPKQSNTTRGFWFDIDNNGTTAPSTGATSNFEINSITLDMDEEKIFEEISNAISETGLYLSEYSVGGVLVTDIATGAITTQLNAGTSGFIMTQVQAGVTSPVAGKLLQYKSFVFGDSDTLSCDIYGKTIDGNTTSRMLKTAPEIVRDLLILAGSGSYINETKFAQVGEYFSEELAFCIPQKFNDKASSLTYRDVINSINGSVLGLLIQNNEFELEYSKLKPRSFVKMRLDQTDILEFSVESSNKNMLKQSVVEFGFKEYDYATREPSIQTVSSTSGIGQHILKTNRSRVFNSLCVSPQDAQRLSDRWSFILEYSSNSFSFTTKLQTAHLQINDIILIDHPKLYSRLGSTGQSRIVMIESIAKKGDLVEITAIDLSNAFNRVAKITDSIQSWSTASDDTRLLGGFYKGIDGIIDGDLDSIETNLIW